MLRLPGCSTSCLTDLRNTTLVCYSCQAEVKYICRRWHWVYACQFCVAYSYRNNDACWQSSYPTFTSWFILLFASMDWSCHHANLFSSIQLLCTLNRYKKSYWLQTRLNSVLGIGAGLIRAFCPGPFLKFRKKITSFVCSLTKRRLSNRYFLYHVSQNSMLLLLGVVMKPSLLLAEGMFMLLITFVFLGQYGLVTCLEQNQESNDSSVFL